MSKFTKIPTAFVLVPGAFCPGECFHKVTEILTSKDYVVRQIDLPSVGEHKDSPQASTADDADHIRRIAATLLDDGKNVVLVGNSYGGFVITEAAKGLDKSSTESEKGEIVHLVYLASLLAPVGMKVHEIVGIEAPVSTAKYIPPMPAAAAGAALFSELSSEEQAKYGAMQKPHSAVAMTGRLTYAAYEYYPTTVVVPLKDKLLSPEIQLKKFEEVRTSGVCKKGLRRVEIEADHCCMLSRADEVVRVLVEAAEGRK